MITFAAFLVLAAVCAGLISLLRVTLQAPVPAPLPVPARPLYAPSSRQVILRPPWERTEADRIRDYYAAVAWQQADANAWPWLTPRWQDATDSFRAICGLELAA